MSKEKKEVKAPVDKEPTKDQIINMNKIYISKLEQKVANQAVTITQLETNIEIIQAKQK